MCATVLGRNGWMVPEKDRDGAEAAGGRTDERTGEEQQLGVGRAPTDYRETSGGGVVLVG